VFTKVAKVEQNIVIKNHETFCHITSYLFS
jgi:hypothetical protein